MSPWWYLVIAVVIVILVILGIVLWSNCDSTTRIRYHRRVIHAKLYAMLETLDHNLIQRGIDYSITCGTLLGAIREGGIIRYDDDVDIDVYQDQLPAVVEVLE